MGSKYTKIGLASAPIDIECVAENVSEYMTAGFDFSYDPDFKNKDDLVVPDDGEYKLEHSNNGKFFRLWTSGVVVNSEAYNIPELSPAGYITHVRATPTTEPTNGGLTNLVGNWDLTYSDMYPSSLDPIVTGDTFTVVNNYRDRGQYDASFHLFPEEQTMVGPKGFIQAGDRFRVIAPGILDGVPINIGEYLLALVDSPGQTAANWIRTYGILDGKLITPGSQIKAVVDNPGQSPADWLVTPGPLYVRFHIARF